MNRINNQDLLTQSQILNNAKNDQTLRTPGNTAPDGSLDNTTLTPAWSLLRSAHWTLKPEGKKCIHQEAYNQFQNQMKKKTDRYGDGGTTGAGAK